MPTLSRDQFRALLDAAGVSEAQKHRFQAELERRHPEAHRQLLEWLGIPAAEIAKIRARSARVSDGAKSAHLTPLDARRAIARP